MNEERKKLKILGFKLLSCTIAISFCTLMCTFIPNDTVKYYAMFYQLIGLVCFGLTVIFCI